MNTILRKERNSDMGEVREKKKERNGVEGYKYVKYSLYKIGEMVAPVF